MQVARVHETTMKRHGASSIFDTSSKREALNSCVFNRTQSQLIYQNNVQLNLRFPNKTQQ